MGMPELRREAADAEERRLAEGLGEASLERGFADRSALSGFPEVIPDKLEMVGAGIHRFNLPG